MVTLFDPITLGDIECDNRIFMAPMTRSRAGEGDAPTEMKHFITDRGRVQG